MRQSTAGLALIQKPDAPPRWLVRWNDGWQAYSLVGGRQHEGESFRDCVCREVSEELRLAEETEYRVGTYPLACAAYRALSRSALEETEYRLALFAVELLGDAAERVSGDPVNRWVTRREIKARRADDGRPISGRVQRMFDAADDAQFDLFVSYARADNTGGQVTRLVEHFREEHARFAPLDPFGIFFDVWGIRDGDDWERRIHRGLSHSKVMLAILSPNYFKSEWCRREWQTFVDVEMSRTYPGDAIHSIYIVTHPDFETATSSPDDGWLSDLQRRQFVDAKPWWPAGTEALQRADVRRRLTLLREAVCDRVDKARQIDRSPRNLRERNPNFVGRDDELRRVRDLLTLRQTAAVTAIQGIGGIGKSAMAREYAHRFRLEYPGGQFEIDMSRIRSTDELRLAIIGLANDHFDARIPPEKMQSQLDRAFDEARALFETRPQILLILDNVDDARLVSKANRTKCLPTPERVHVILTSRLEPGTLGGIEPLPLDALSTADALDLIARYRPIADDTANAGRQAARLAVLTPDLDESVDGNSEWKAVLRIVNRLGCHALAVEVVAVYLGEHREISLSDYLRGLIRKGIGAKLAQAGDDPGVQARIEHPETLIAPLLEPTLARLSPLEMCVLEWAALLPPDNVPLAWLRELASADFADVLQHDPDDPDPWITSLKRLDGLRLLTTTTAERLGRIHRIVQSVVCEMRNPDDLARDRQRFDRHAEARAKLMCQNWGRPDVNWELDALFDFARQRLDAEGACIGYLAKWLNQPLKLAGRLMPAVGLQKRVIAFESRRLERAPENADYAHDLSVSFGMMGELFHILGDGVQAREFYERALAISKRLTEQAPENGDYADKLSVSYEKLGDLLSASGEGAQARAYYEQTLAVRRRLTGQAPENANYAHNLAIMLDRMGDRFLRLEDREQAQAFYEQELAIREQLAARFPENADYIRGLSWGVDKMGDLSLALGDSVRAQEFYERSLAIRERLAAQAPDNAEIARDRSVSFNNLGDLFLALKDGARAREFYEKSLTVRKRLAEQGPENASRQRDLWETYVKTASILEKTRSPAEALTLWRRAVQTILQMKQKGMFISPEEEKIHQYAEQKIGGMADTEEAGD